MKEINQCDGCQQGLPVKNGIHRKEGEIWGIGCTKDRYQEEETLPSYTEVVDVSNQ